MKDKKKMSPYVARLSYGNANWLGVATSGHILTCSFPSLFFGMTWRCVPVFECVLPGEKPNKYYPTSWNCLLDFMVLEQVLPELDLEDDLDLPAIEIDPLTKPAQLVFPVGVDQVKLPVYIYAPDSKTIWHTTAKVYRDQFYFELHHTLLDGCMGGPVFTEDHRLIGCVMGHGGLYSNESYSVATRIDLAAPGWLRAWLGGFDDLRLAEYAVEENPSKSDKWSCESYFVGKSLRDIDEVYVGCA